MNMPLTQSPDHSPESYVGYIRETIEYLRAEVQFSLIQIGSQKSFYFPDNIFLQMPRTFVNVVKMLDVTQITALGGVVCNIVHL